jgi:hypothetical protein
MRKTLWKVGFSTVAVVLLSSSAAYAQATDTVSLNVTVTVASRARLTLGVAGITFADADPDVTPIMSAGPVAVNVGARTAPTSTVTLTVLASGNLVSGSDVITIDQLTWTVGGPSAGFVAGTSNSTVAQSVGSWTGPGTRNGTQTFALPNSWAYAPGTYTSTLNYTLSVP